MPFLPRRGLLAAAGALGAVGAARAASFGNPDNPPQGAINARGTPTGLTNPGPQNPALAGQFPSFQDPPATDVDGMPLFWASFNNAHRRIQNGGWAREVTQDDFAISQDIAGVNMRLAAGGIREMHWHQQAEWAYMTNGRCRITTLDDKGRPSVDDVGPGDLWYFPAGLPHSLQGLGPDGAEFLLAFDNGRASEFNTLLLTDWLAHTPPECWRSTSTCRPTPSSTFRCRTFGSSRARSRVRWTTTAGRWGRFPAPSRSSSACRR